MSQRMITDENTAAYQSEDCTPNFLAENNPNFVNYMPTQEIAEKLIRRMIDLKEDPAKDLWSGFQVKLDQYTGGFKYAIRLEKEPEVEEAPVPQDEKPEPTESNEQPEPTEIEEKPEPIEIDE